MGKPLVRGGGLAPASAARKTAADAEISRDGLHAIRSDGLRKVLDRAL